MQGANQNVYLFPVEQVPGALVQVDKDLNLQAFNNDVLQEFKLEKVEFQGYWKSIKSSIKTAEEFILTRSPNRQLKGSCKPFESGFLIRFENISDRLQALTALHAAENRFYTLAQTCPTGILRFNELGSCVFANYFWCNLAQTTLKQSLGGGWLDLVAIEDRASLANTLRLARSKEQEVFQEYRLLGISKKTTWVFGAFSPERDAEGRVTGYLHTLIDITERKLAEAALSESNANMQAILETSAEGIMTLNQHGEVLAVNKALEKMFGLPQIDLVSKKFNSLVEKLETQSGEPWKEFTWDTFEERRGWARNSQGQLFPVAVRFRGIAMKSQSNFVMAILRDESKVYELERNFLHTQKMEGLGLLAGGVAHDFNNLLTAILGFAELGLVGVKDKETRAHFSEVLKAGTRAKELVQQILSFSRKYEQEKVSTDLAQEVLESLKLVRGTLPSGVELTHDIGPDCGFIECPRGQINQILMNLCTNAFHALPRGIGKISIQLSHCEPPEEREGNWVKLEVKDNGTGICEEKKKRIFDPFFTTKKEGQGTGMGLAVIKGIVANYGGTIGVESKIGTGSTFVIYLPIKLKPFHLKPKKTIKESLAGSGSILILDDEPQITRLLEQFLSTLGYSVTTAQVPEHALQLISQKDPFDLFITDLTMPHMDGYEVAEAAKAKDPHLKIILTSGFRSADTNKKARAAGINAFYLKPIDFKKFARDIKALISQEQTVNP